LQAKSSGIAFVMSSINHCFLLAFRHSMGPLSSNRE
jgi:hypothetical protein